MQLEFGETKLAKIRRGVFSISGTSLCITFKSSKNDLEFLPQILKPYDL